ncbi:hypothetical protein [Clostridium grantii]|uniref:Type IV pilus assembly protein PilO n=1 Tax=Clostridium grantii DSM 8605 TaxID=1121316 RepID=A0A1M5RI26_9CLOT|nr:hypothetical protein [Clostridium grantii]SHH25965.1 hypothetical protein SAMN02745207_00547 [Clostridium grantii DSM 8605]
MNRFKNINIKILIIAIILIIGIFFAYYKLVLQAQRNQINELTETNDIYLAELEQVRQDEALIKEIKSNIETIGTNIDGTVKAYFPSLNQEKIILILDSFLDDNNLKSSSMSFSSANVEVLQPLSNEEEAQEFLLKDLAEQYSNIQNGVTVEEKSTEESQSNEDSTSTEGTASTGTEEVMEESNISGAAVSENEASVENTFSVENMNISLELEGSYEDITNFINDINNYSKKILIKDITIISTETEVTSAGGGGGDSIDDKSNSSTENGTTSTDSATNQDGTNSYNTTTNSDGTNSGNNTTSSDGITNSDGTTSEDPVVLYTIQTITASINLNFYAIPKLKDDETDYDYKNWTINSLYGKKNPFE